MRQTCLLRYNDSLLRYNFTAVVLGEALYSLILVVGVCDLPQLYEYRFLLWLRVKRPIIELLTSIHALNTTRKTVLHIRLCFLRHSSLLHNGGQLVFLT